METNTLIIIIFLLTWACCLQLQVWALHKEQDQLIDEHCELIRCHNALASGSVLTDKFVCQLDNRVEQLEELHLDDLVEEVPVQEPIH